jgi:hypothetical protein
MHWVLADKLFKTRTLKRSKTFCIISTQRLLIFRRKGNTSGKSALVIWIHILKFVIRSSAHYLPFASTHVAGKLLAAVLFCTQLWASFMLLHYAYSMRDNAAHNTADLNGKCILFTLKTSTLNILVVKLCLYMARRVSALSTQSSRAPFTPTVSFYKSDISSELTNNNNNNNNNLSVWNLVKLRIVW